MLDLFDDTIELEPVPSKVDPVYTYKLVAVYDLRDIDEWTGE